MCIYVYVRVQLRTLHPRYTRPCPYYRCTAARHETHHGHVLRHAIEHVYYGHPPRTIHPHLSRVGSSVVHGTPAFSFLFPPECFFLVFCVFDFLSLSLRYSSLPRPPCYRVQGQPIEGNFLVPIAFARPPRTIRFVSFPLFYSSELFLFLRYTFLFLFTSLFIYFSFSLLFYRVALQIRGERCQDEIERSIDGNWSAMHSTVGELDRTCRGCELKLKVPPILGEIFVNR